MDLRVTGDWQVSVKAGRASAELAVAPPVELAVVADRYDALPTFDAKAAGWRKGAALAGVRAQECTAKGALVPDSLVVRTAPDAGAPPLTRGQDYDADLEWGTVGRLPGGRLAADQPVWLSYRHGTQRLDSIVLTADGCLALRPGAPRVTLPQSPALAAGETRLANVLLEPHLPRLTEAQLFPVLEAAFPETPATTPIEQLLPRTMARLRGGGALRVLAWGDSVTDGSFLPGGDADRWQSQFVARLRLRFPAATITLVSEAWGGRNTAAYLAEPPGSPHNYREKVLGARPDLIVSEFVNDAGLTPAQVDERYGQLLADFRAIGAEWIILTPHYVRPDWMGLTRQRDIDDDPRPYVHGLRAFAARRGVALADASLRWGRLWRQGLPYNTLMHNTINHPDARGMKLFADSLMALLG